MRLGMIVHYIAVSFLFSVWEYWLGKTKRVAANSTLELLGWIFKQLVNRAKGETKMDKDIKLGNAGDLDLAFSGGKATLALKAGAPTAGVSASVQLSVDSSVLIDLLFAAIEKASPAGAAPIEEGVKSIIKSAVTAL